MSTFGEIVEPLSRSVWEDWDEVNTNDYSRLQWQSDIKVSENIETLLILEGKYLADSIKKQTGTKMDLVNAVPELNLHLFKTETNEFICVLQEYNLVQSSEIIELLKDLIAISNNVITILTKPLVEFQSSEVLTQGRVIRSLSTSKPLTGVCTDVIFPKLEQPNIISGVSAGVVWLREILGLSALAVVFYLELVQEQQIQELQMFLEKFNIVTPKTQPVPILHSNLYI